MNRSGPRSGLTEAARLTGTSRSTIKRRLAAGDFPNATKDEDGTWRFSPADLLAAGLKLRTPADASRRDDEDQGDDEAAELLERIADLERLLTIERVRRESAELMAAEREKRAQTAERALLMLEARPSPVTSQQPDPITVRRLTEVTESNVTQFRSITGGDRTLRADRCTCGYVSYSLRERGGDPQVIGADPGIITAALHALVAQPVDVFVMELLPNRPVNVIVPRHHLPLMMVETR